MRETKIQIYIMSIMSDLPYKVAAGSDAAVIRKQTEFVKGILLKYPDTNVMVPFSELEALWEETN